MLDFKPFLTAEWKHLLFVNYAVPSEVLQPFVPEFTQLDLHEGVAYISLVAFCFEKTRVMGVPMPGHEHFEEVNLRFYVATLERPEVRAVTFVQEIVPLPTVPLIANTFFGEQYVDLPMAHRIHLPELSYSFGEERQYHIAATVGTPSVLPQVGSHAHFITEHYWGYAQAKGRTLEYQVHHEPWPSSELNQFEVKVDFAQAFSPTFAFLNQQNPASVLYAEGSSVAVSYPQPYFPKGTG